MGEMEQETQAYFELLLDEGYPYETAKQMAYQYTQQSNEFMEITNV